MKYLATLLLFITGTISVFAQLKITPENLAALNKEAQILEQHYLIADKPIYKSKLQTSGTYFLGHITDKEQFKKDFETISDTNTLQEKYPILRMDHNLIVTKSLEKNRDKTHQIIGFDGINSFSQKDDIPIYELENIEASTPMKYFRFIEHDNLPYVEGFFLDREFKRHNIPSRYSNWITYSNVITDNRAPVYLEKCSEKTFDNTPDGQLDSLRCNRPNYFCGTHSGPRLHEIKIFNQSAEARNWIVYINSYINILLSPTDSFRPESDSPTLTKCIKDVENIHVDMDKLIFRHALDYSDHNNTFDRNRRSISIARLIWKLDEPTKSHYIDKINGVLKDKNVDSYNKSLFIKILKYIRLLESGNGNAIQNHEDIHYLYDYLSPTLQDQITNYHSYIYDYYPNEKELLDQYDITFSWINGYILVLGLSKDGIDYSYRVNITKEKKPFTDFHQNRHKYTTNK